MTVTVTSRILFGDHATYYRLVKSESGFRVPTYDAIVARFLTIWPAGLDWPEHIPKIDEADVRGVPGMRIDEVRDGPLADERARLAEIATRLGIARPTADAA